MLVLTQYVSHFWKSAADLLGLEFERLPLPSVIRTARSNPSRSASALTTSPASNPDDQNVCTGVRSPSDRRVRLNSYQSLSQLSQQLTGLDGDQEFSHSTVILVLAENFAGHLPSLIARVHRGSRLVLVVANGRVPLPGLVTLGDLAARENALGWGQILFERDLADAVNGSWHSLNPRESLVVLWPAWKDQSTLTQLLQSHGCESGQTELD